MSFTRETLSDFLSSIFIIGMGRDLKKSLDEGAMMDNFEEWIMDEKKNLILQKKSLARLLADLRPILLPIVCGDGDSIGLHHDIKQRSIQNYPIEIYSENLDSTVEEAMISAARKIYNFFEILAQELDLDLWADSEAEWGDNLLEDVSFSRAKSIPDKIDLDGVLKEVFCKETRHYIIHHLEKQPPQKGLSRRDSDQAIQVRVDKWLSEGGGRERPKFLRILEGQWKNISLRCRTVLMLSIFLGALLAPTPSLSALLIWDVWRNKKEKRAVALEIKSSLFKAQKSRAQRLPRPRELMSEDEGSGRHLSQG